MLYPYNTGPGESTLGTNSGPQRCQSPPESLQTREPYSRGALFVDEKFALSISLSVRPIRALFFPIVDGAAGSDASVVAALQATLATRELQREGTTEVDK